MTFVAVRLNALSYPVEGAEERELKRAGAKLIAVEGQKPEEIIAAAENATRSGGFVERAGRSNQRLNRCRVISRLGAGTDKIDIEEATRQGIVVANVPDFCTNEQAEHAFSLLLGLDLRRLPFMLGAMRQGQWTGAGPSGRAPARGANVGLLGFGEAPSGRRRGRGLRAAAAGLCETRRNIPPLASARRAS